MNKLYFGDNLDVLREYVPDQSVDLVYLDPPFNSQANYNVLFRAPTGQSSEAQAEAFRDTWKWEDSARDAYDDVLRMNGEVALVLSGFRRWLGENAMMAYLAMMAVRLIELRRAMKPDGSIYLHCDSTASHYVKLLLDALFGHRNFRNEIIWQRTGAHSDAKRYGRVTDTILFYTKSDQYTYNQQYVDYDPAYVAERYRYVDEATGRLFWPNTMTAAGPGPARSFRGKTRTPPANTHWRFSQSEIDRYESEGRIYYSKTGIPYVKSFLDERKGRPVQNLWTDIVMSKSGFERMGYPTQKPLLLLDRIIRTSSNEDAVILDPFCGCGTTVEAAQSLGRGWLGIDVTHYAVTLIEGRLDRAGVSRQLYNVTGRPTDLSGARELARRDKHQFQWWAAWRLGARWYREEKKGADRGIDGRMLFKNGPYGDGLIIISVKGGENISVKDVRDLRGVIEREEAEMGILVTLVEPTGPMVTEVASAGFVSKSAHGRLPRLQVVTIESILENRLPQLPPLPQVERRPVRIKRKPGSPQMELLLPFEGRKILPAKGDYIDPSIMSFG